MGWKRRPKILVVGDSSRIHTGFARVIKEVCFHLYKTGDYELKTIGWFDKDTGEVIPYEIIPTFKDTGDLVRTERDKYSAETLPRVIEGFKPDVVLAVGDFWMVEPTVLCRQKHDFKLICYIPVDGMPIPERFTKIARGADVVVAYGEFGMKIIRQRDPDICNLTSINHGVDLDTFKPLDNELKKEVRKQFGGDDKFIIGSVSRNQPRKNYPRLFKAARLFINPFSVCEDCGEVFLEYTSACQVCGSKNVFQGEEKKNVVFYLHMALKDCGWDIPDLVKRFALGNIIAYPLGLQIGHGVEVDRLVEIMNAFDVFTLPTSGEGWGLGIIEAMACGIPCVVTDYSAHTDFCSDCAEMIAVSEFITEPITNIERALVDVYDYVMRLDRLYYDDKDLFLKKWGRYLKDNYNADLDTLVIGSKLRENMSKLSIKKASQYSWSRINREWVNLINSTLEYNPEEVVEDEAKIVYETEEI